MEIERTLTLNVEENEFWWGGSPVYSSGQPYDNTSTVHLVISETGYNQSAPLFLSSNGRVIHTSSPTEIWFDRGTVTVRGDDPVCFRRGSTLRDAYLAAADAFFPFEDKKLPKEFFYTAQFNTWMEFTYEPTQEKVLSYANEIVSNGYKPGILIIDEGWSAGYGTWDFDFHKFPDPKCMIDILHKMGFIVMLWIVPYVTADGRAYLDHVFPLTASLQGHKFRPRLCRTPNGDVALVRWWNGISAMFDLTSDEDRKYLTGRLDRLMENYGVDGFKFDGGNIASLRPLCWITDPPVKSAQQLNQAWNDFGMAYEYHEFKDTFDRGGRAVIQRVRDRNHTWDGEGLNTLLPFVLSQGLLGYPYICPDMIGGGEWTWNLRADFKCDQELFVRMAQCSALLPMMQFSWAPWRLLSKENQQICLEAANLHSAFSHKIIDLVKDTPLTHEPIIRSMEYSFPHCGYERVTDQFMLGPDLLVCPVLKQGTAMREVMLPEGTWRYLGERLYIGGGTVSVSAPLNVLPWFERN